MKSLRLDLFQSKIDCVLGDDNGGRPDKGLKEDRDRRRRSIIPSPQIVSLRVCASLSTEGERKRRRLSWQLCRSAFSPTQNGDA